MQSKEIEQLASEFEKCQRILIALGDENRLHMIPDMKSFNTLIQVLQSAVDITSALPDRSGKDE